LPVSFSGIPVKIQVEGCELLLKDSFHVSLVCIGKIIEKNQLTIPDFVNKVIADFYDFTSKINIELDQYRDEFRLVSENDRKSVVVMCDIKNLDNFFAFLNNKYKLNLEYPPTHVTLYTLQPNLGIFLTDTDDIKRLTKRIEAPIKLE
jgi:hypothetical protein